MKSETGRFDGKDAKQLGLYIQKHTSILSTAEKQMVAELLVYGTSDRVTTKGLACLFGHKYVEKSVVTITHRVNETQPRCLKEYFLINTCSRCGKTTTERTGFMYINCCA